MIIENEEVSIENIKAVLSSFENLYCVGTSGDREESMNIIFKEMPSLVFLCIDDVIKKPFQFVHVVKQHLDNPPLIIALSLTKTKAYKAFKHNFFDYLLKPISELDLRKTILKIQKDKFFQSAQTVCLKSYQDYKYLNANDILFLKADNNTTDFHMKDGTTISAFKTLKTYEGVLPKNFLRIHKSYIINSKYVSGINYGKCRCSMSSDRHSNIPFTKTYIDNVRAINNTLSKSSLVSLN